MTKGEKTRTEIIAAAAGIFNKRGYEGCTLSDLMEATGLKKGGIYRHFSSKEELAAEAFDYAWNAAWETRMRHIDEQLEGVAQLKLFIANFIDCRPAVPGGCPVLNTAVDSDDGNKVIRARVSRALAFWLEQLQSFVEHAKREGTARSSVNAREVASIVVASLEGALMMSRLDRSDAPLRLVQDHLNSYLDNQVSA